MPHPTVATLSIPHEVHPHRRTCGGMSHASNPADAGADARSERVQHWIALLASALLHVLFLCFALWTSAIKVTPPQGTAGGSRMAVEFIGASPPQPTQGPPTPAKPASTTASNAPAKSRVQTTPVPRADDTLPPEDADDAAQAQAPAATSPQLPQPRSRTWGQPPGMLQENLAPQHAGLARSAATDRGRGNDTPSATPSMEVDGYQVYYDLRSERRLRAWRDQGMTELFMPLPGTRRYMVCPLETALRRESGPCRLLEPDSPELAAIGDAREAINMQKVYRLGEEVWSGPGAYK